MGIGLTARIKQENDKEKIEFGSETNQYKRMDYGINLGIGFEVEPVQIGINYGFGFINISNFPSEEIRNRVFTIYVVYSIKDLISRIRF